MDLATFPQNKNKKNLTINRIINMSMWTGTQKIVLNDYKIKLEAGAFVKSIRDARNKIIGHNDLDVYENDDLESLGEFEEGLDKEFIVILEEFCNYIHKESFGNIWGEFIPSSPGDVKELIGELYRAQVFHEILEDPSSSIELKSNLVGRLVALQRA